MWTVKYYVNRYFIQKQVNKSLGIGQYSPLNNNNLQSSYIRGCMICDVGCSKPYIFVNHRVSHSFARSCKSHLLTLPHSPALPISRSHPLPLPHSHITKNSALRKMCSIPVFSDIFSCKRSDAPCTILSFVIVKRRNFWCFCPILCVWGKRHIF